MPISFTNDQRVPIPAEEYWQHQLALSEHSLIGREALSHSEISDRIEVLKRFESVGIMSAGEIEWLHARWKGSRETFEKWAWRELRESVFEIHVQATEFEGRPFWMPAQKQRGSFGGMRRSSGHRLAAISYPFCSHESLKHPAIKP